MKEYQLHGLRALAQSPKGTVPAFLQAPATQGAWRFHHALEDYGPTPLVRLNGLAEELGLGGVFVKDESHRFGLNAFKGLGGIYALSRAVARELGLPAEVTLEELQAPSVQKEVRNMVFVTTTDGNHGRGVAWAARKLGCEAHVYLPAGSAPARAQAILDAGAVEARVLPLGYDDAVRYAAQQAQEKGWTLIQDTSWPGYEEIPTWIVQGYTTLAREAADQLAEAGPPTSFCRPVSGPWPAACWDTWRTGMGPRRRSLPWWSRRTSQASMPLPKPVTVSPIRPRARGRPSWRALTVQSPVP